MTSRAQDVALYLSNQFQGAWDGFGFFDLQRLMYLAQGWHLAGGGGVLFSESIGAHRSAPLTLSIKGLLPMDEMLPHPVLDPADEAFLESFCDTYLMADRAAVRRQVEREDGAWRLAQLVGGEGATIHPDLMEATFRLRLLDHITTQQPVRKTLVASSHFIAHQRQMLGSNVVSFRR